MSFPDKRTLTQQFYVDLRLAPAIQATEPSRVMLLGGTAIPPPRMMFCEETHMPRKEI